MFFCMGSARKFYGGRVDVGLFCGYAGFIS